MTARNVRGRRRVARHGLAITLVGMTMLTPSALARPARCAERLTPAAALSSVPQPVTARDLVALRDIGEATSSARADPPFAISPDGKRVAFLMRRADPDANSYCQGLFVLDIRPDAQPRLVDEGGEPIRITIADLRGLRVPTGILATIQPIWAADGRSLYYRRRENGVTQIWRTGDDGRDSRALTALATDVETMALTRDGRALVFTSRPQLVNVALAQEAEARSGFIFGMRSVPLASAVPAMPALDPSYFAYDLETGAKRPATVSESALLAPSRNAARPPGAELLATHRDGRRAWTANSDSGDYLAPARLWAESADGQPVMCTSQQCAGGIVAIWWLGRAQTLIYLRQEGWGEGSLAFYSWTPGASRPVRLSSTEELLMGCQPVAERLLCAHEAPTRPRKLMLVDPYSAAKTMVFDPNPEYAHRVQPSVRRLYWRNAFGIASYGDLVLPTDHKPGQKHPLIVVQYRSKGFLRGGTGDEYPIPAFAARGFAVLSIDRPPPYAGSVVKGRWARWQDARRVNFKDWGERRTTLSALINGIAAATRSGAIDPERIGLTGVSDGAATAWFALINHNIFAAAALSQCCEDPKTDLLMGGPAWEQDRELVGYPAHAVDDPAFWKPYSLAMNAATIRTPILMQLSDDEYLMGLESYSALRHHKTPTELVVFPGEHHVKWQPAHRLAVYARNLDWFDYWLRNRRDPDPAKGAQYARWDLLRVEAKP